MFAIDAYQVSCNWARFGFETVFFCSEQRLFTQITIARMSIKMKRSTTATTIPTTTLTTRLDVQVVMGAVAEGGVKLASIQASYMSLSPML